MAYRRAPFFAIRDYCLVENTVNHSESSVAMNFKEISPQGTTSASERNQSSLITPVTSTACTGYADMEGLGALPHFLPSDPNGDRSDGDPDDGSNLPHCLCGEHSCAEQRRLSGRLSAAASPNKGSSGLPEGLVPFLMAQNEYLAERLGKAETMLGTTRNQDNASETSHCPGLVADNEDGDDHSWEAVKLAMKESVELAMKDRQQVEESLQEECRQLREGLSHVLPLVGLTMAHFDPNDTSASLEARPDPSPAGFPLPDIGAQLETNVFGGPQVAYGQPKERGTTYAQMKEVREGLRIVIKICTMLCIIAGIVALLRLPGQLSGPLRLNDQKQRGMGAWVHW
jgi:hypothetical protein